MTSCTIWSISGNDIRSVVCVSVYPWADLIQKWDYCQIREFTMFNGVEGYGPSLAEVPLDLSGPPREAPKSLLERIEERKMMCHVEESC
jgi:hypothetical protein